MTTATQTITISTTTLRDLFRQVEKAASLTWAISSRPLLETALLTLNNSELTLLVCNGFSIIEASTHIDYDADALEMFVKPVKLPARKSATVLDVSDTEIRFTDLTTNNTVVTPLYDADEDDFRSFEGFREMLDSARLEDPASTFTTFDQTLINSTLNGYKGAVRYKLLDARKMYIETNHHASNLKRVNRTNISIRALVMGIRD